MAGQILSQEEVDKLISSAMTDDFGIGDDTKVQTKEKPAAAENAKKIKKNSSMNLRYKTKYISPVIRRENIVFNPAGPTWTETGKIPVYSLPAFSA